MTAQEKEIIIQSVDWTNSKLPDLYRLSCAWYECQYNGHIVKLTSPNGNYLTALTEYTSTYSFLDGYRKAVQLVSVCEAPEASYSPVLVSA